MDDKYVGINLQIDGVTYPLTILREEEPCYRQAARLINEKLIIYKQTYVMDGGVKLVTMVALDIAFNRIKNARETNNEHIIDKLEELTTLIDKNIADRQ